MREHPSLYTRRSQNRQPTQSRKRWMRPATRSKLSMSADFTSALGLWRDTSEATTFQWASPGRTSDVIGGASFRHAYMREEPHSQPASLQLP